MENFVVTEDRLRKLQNDEEIATGVMVRAQHPVTKRWNSYDVAALDKPSMLAWLKSRGGDNHWAENFVGIILGYGPLHEVPGQEN